MDGYLKLIVVVTSVDREGYVNGIHTSIPGIELGVIEPFRYDGGDSPRVGDHIELKFRVDLDSAGIRKL